MLPDSSKPVSDKTRTVQADSSRGVLGFTHANGQTGKASYDQAGRLTHWQDGSYQSGISYNRTQQISQVTQQNQTQQLSYDTANRLSAVQQGANSEQYQYDNNGNRVAYQANNQQFSYQYEPSTDRLQQYQATANKVSYQYDVAGNPTQIIGSDKANQTHTRQFSYTPRGQIANIHDDNHPATSYGYNYAMQRVSKTQGNQTTRYLWQSGLLDAEIKAVDGQEKLSRRYIYLGMRPIAVIDYDKDNQASIYSVNTDYLGTPKQVTDSTGKVVWEASHDAFGNLISEKSNQFVFNLRFAGQYHDIESGYYYNYHRYYDAKTGRYLTSDPIGLIGGLNTYNYVGQDPFGETDSSGLFVDLIFSRSVNKLYLYDNDPPPNKIDTFLIVNNIFTGGKIVNGVFQVTKNADIPLGKYQIYSWGNKGWFRLDAEDSTPKNDWHDGANRGFFRLHPGSISEGCVTVDKAYPENWRLISQFILTTTRITQVSVTSWKTFPLSSHIANFPNGGRYTSYKDSLIYYGELNVIK